MRLPVSPVRPLVPTLVAAALALTACGGAGADDAPVVPRGSGSSVGAPSTAGPASPGSSTAAPSAAAPPTGQVDPAAVQVVATGLQAPWGLDFLPDGSALVTERDTARVLRVPLGGGDPAVVTTVAVADPGGEGGLLGLAVSPRFAADGLVYVYVSTATDNRVVRFPLAEPEKVEPILTGIPRSGIHNGGRIAFGPDGMLYIGTGDAGDTSRAQDPASLGGKVLRVTPDGAPAPGTSPVFSLGHRNVQGLAFDADGRLFTVEFGQNTFDEVNQVVQGSNGGWPIVEGPGTGGGRFLAPVVTWSPQDASPSGGAILGDQLYVAALRGQRLWQVPLDGSGGAGTPTALLTGEFGRLRTAVKAPDGSLWVLTSNRDGRGRPAATDDRILRLPPV